VKQIKIINMVDVLVINYTEKSFKKTLDCLPLLEDGTHIIIQDREPKGIGSLAQAINIGAKRVTNDYFCVVTNIEFDETFNDFLKTKGHVAIQPCYASDHQALRPKGNGIVKVAFTEFTCVLLHTESFNTLKGVDELMPYVGFDIDFGIRANQLGSVACHNDFKIEHTYNRFMGYDPITVMRKRMRRSFEDQTYKRLAELYGIDRRTKLPAYPWERHLNPSLPN